MKKIILNLFLIIFALTVVSCESEQKIDITEEKEFADGEILEYDGVIYEYFVSKPRIESKGTEYMFKEEDNYNAYYDYYYYDMSDYKNQKEMKPIDLWDYPNKKAIESDIGLNPTAYFYRVSGVFFRETPCPISDGFIIKGYNENLPEDVIIPNSLYGKTIQQVGFRAFENALMRSFKWSNDTGIIHPYAFYNCNNLEVLNLSYDYVCSMGISNCEKLKTISGNVYALGDCIFYDLPNLVTVKRQIIFSVYGILPVSQGGIRKSIFYKCPKIRDFGDSYLKIDNVIYAPGYVPIYVLDDYVVRLNDLGFKKENRSYYSVTYDLETLEAYLPFLNDGLDKKGKIIIPQDSDVFVEEEDGIYANVTYENEIYNTKVLIRKNKKAGE